MSFLKFLLLPLWSILVYLSFPGGTSPLLTWIAFVPFGLAIGYLKLRQTITWVTTFSLITWTVCTGWLAIGVANIGQMPAINAALIALLPIINFSLPYILFSFLAKKLLLFHRDNLKPLSAAALLTFLITLTPNYFPNSIAQGLYQQTAFIQICDIGGVTLLLFIVNAVNFLLCSAVLTFRDRRICASYILFAFLILGTVYVYGNYRINQWESIIKNSRKIKVGLIQPNIPILRSNQTLYVKESSKENGFETLVQQTRKLAQKNDNIDLFIWPEVPFDLEIKTNSPMVLELNKLLLEIKKPLVTNATFAIPNEQKIDRLYNAMHLIQHDTSNIQTYLKNRLVPFAEYNPAENITYKLFNIRYFHYSFGWEVNVFQLGETIKIGTPICLEAIYSDFIESFIMKGASLIINPSNDSYFGYSRGAEVHLALTTFRAIEYRIPLIRATNSGISQVIDQTGHFQINDSALFTENSWVADIAIPDSLKAYDPNKTGTIINIIFLFSAILKSIWNRFSKAK